MDRIEPLTDSTDLLGDAGALRAQAYAEGYLFLPGLLPRQEIQSIRAQLLEILADAGWIDTSAPREAAIANLDSFCAEPDPKFVEVFWYVPASSASYEPSTACPMADAQRTVVAVHASAKIFISSLSIRCFVSRNGASAPFHRPSILEEETRTPKQKHDRSREIHMKNR